MVLDKPISLGVSLGHGGLAVESGLMAEAIQRVERGAIANWFLKMLSWADAWSTLSYSKVTNSTRR